MQVKIRHKSAVKHDSQWNLKNKKNSKKGTVLTVIASECFVKKEKQLASNKISSFELFERIYKMKIFWSFSYRNFTLQKRSQKEEKNFWLKNCVFQFTL